MVSLAAAGATDATWVIVASAELAALAKLTSNWRGVIEDNATTVEERADLKRGQKKLFE